MPRMSSENSVLVARLRSATAQARFEVAQSSVANTWSSDAGQPAGWRTFLNHAPEIAAMDLFVVPTLLDLLYAYIIVRLDRRELVWISVNKRIRPRIGLCARSQKHPVE